MVTDHYPYEKWLAIIGNINPTFSGPNPNTALNPMKNPIKPPFSHGFPMVFPWFSQAGYPQKPIALQLRPEVMELCPFLMTRRESRGNGVAPRSRRVVGNWGL